MAKRFTDTDKWKKPWYRKLGSRGRDIFNYLYENCDACGVLELDIERMAFDLGFEVSLRMVKESVRGRVKEFGTSKLFFYDFIEFQYGKLSESCKPHVSIINKLKTYGLFEGYAKGLDTLQEKEQDKEKDKVKEKEKEQERVARVEDPTTELAGEILSEFVRITGRPYRPSEAVLKPIKARLKEPDPPSKDLIVNMIVFKYHQWKDNPEMRSFIRPDTLFRVTKFPAYIAETQEALDREAKYDELFREAV